MEAVEEIEDDHKLDIEPEAPLCRCCLSTKNRMLDAAKVGPYFMDLAGINVLASDGLPLWICYECNALLQKAILFKYKMLRAHTMLYEYVTRCAPFPINGTDPELTQYATPHLSASHILTFDTGKTKHGFHKVLEHEKKLQKTELNSIQLPCLVDNCVPELCDIETRSEVKEEAERFDFEDDLPLEEFKSAANLILKELIENTEDIKTEPVVKKRKKKKETKAKKKKSEEEIEEEPQKKLIRKPIEIDPEKIKVVILNPKEQIKQREEESQASLKFPYQCSLCFKGFNFESKLQNHMAKHSPSRGPFECKLCQMYLPTSYSYSVHSLIHTRRYECLKCGRRMIDKSRGPFECKLCQMYLPTSYSYSVHSLIHTRRYECLKCGRRMIDRASISRGPFECKLCQMYLPTSYSYSVHSLIHTRRYECLKCGRRMIDRASIVHHYRTQHEGISTVITCNLCGKISSNSKTHRGHMRNHHSGERPKCDQCGKTFVNKDSLAEHMQIHEGVKNYECSVCGKRCRTRAQIKLHQLKHSDAKDYYCVECDVRFKTSHSLRQHLQKSLKHLDVQNLKFACGACPRRYPTPRSLAAHEAVRHRGERAHQCPACGAALASRASLHKHAATVHGARPASKHVCHTCGKAFRGASVLTNHLRTHTGEKPFACVTCGRTFSQRTAMRTHLRRVHAEKPAKVESGAETRPMFNVSKEEPQVALQAWPRPQELFYVTAGP